MSYTKWIFGQIYLFALLSHLFNQIPIWYEMIWVVGIGTEVNGKHWIRYPETRVLCLALPLNWLCDQGSTISLSLFLIYESREPNQISKLSLSCIRLNDPQRNLHLFPMSQVLLLDNHRFWSSGSTSSLDPFFGEVVKQAKFMVWVFLPPNLLVLEETILLHSGTGNLLSLSLWTYHSDF